MAYFQVVWRKLIIVSILRDAFQHFVLGLQVVQVLIYAYDLDFFLMNFVLNAGSFTFASGVSSFLAFLIFLITLGPDILTIFVVWRSS